MRSYNVTFSIKKARRLINSSNKKYIRTIRWLKKQCHRRNRRNYKIALKQEKQDSFSPSLLTSWDLV